MLGGGKDREWLRPLTDEGSVDVDGSPELDNLVGCHKGPFIGLNIPNPEAGFEYVWENRKPSEVMRAKMRGGIRVSAQDPEAVALRAFQDEHVGKNESSELDSHYDFNDVTLFKYPVAAIRRIREEEQARAGAMMRGGAAEFADRASAIEQHMSRGKDTRFRRKDHGMQLVDRAENVLDEWKPEDGIIREG
jgi:hypothetical protein